ncbi:Hypothetical predicted protein [Pelobates cultripes]|uniref:Uncharacterized protein n=1 Tax=Pelobates cultripes TaxID=61616 RepID=A0AAD1WFV3_PELCU|nr:Hypothetical predicted protein [Pelobates cultripes]
MADNPKPRAKHYVETNQCTCELVSQHAVETYISIWDKIPNHLEKPEAPAVKNKQRDEGQERSGPPWGSLSTALLQPHTMGLLGLKTTRDKFPEHRPPTQRIQRHRWRIPIWIQRCPLQGKNPASHRSNQIRGPEMQAFATVQVYGEVWLARWTAPLILACQPSSTILPHGSRDQ